MLLFFWKDIQNSMKIKFYFEFAISGIFHFLNNNLLHVILTHIYFLYVIVFVRYVRGLNCSKLQSMKYDR